MGHRVTQRVFQCDVCGTTPDDGEYLWEMGREHWCEDCCDKDSEDVMGESDGRRVRDGNN